jgi:myo-inositol 2-dehydrogenase/D-chiro-inositol 1-dehydrogenase
VDDFSSLRVGVVGAGAISRVHIPAWMALGATVGVFSESGAEEVAARYRTRAVSSWEALLAGVDVVDICTPTRSHASIALEAIAAGRQVICEKPLALRTVDAATMIAAADAAGVRLLPAHVVRYFPEYRTMAAAVSRGEIGRPAVARFTRTGTGPGQGTWFGSVAASGGVVMDLMIHDLDQARWICGEVETVYAVQSPAPDGDVVPAAVTAHAVLTHTGGAISHVQAVWGGPGTAFRTSFDVAGSSGVLHHDSREDAAVVVDILGAERGSGVVPRTGLLESPYLTQLRDFATAIVTGTTPRVTAEDGFVAVALAEAAARSVLTGRPERPVRPSEPAAVTAG